MFNNSVDERLSAWAELRRQIEVSEDPYTDVWNFWKFAPFVPYNPKIDPCYQRGWPRPWEIIVDNKYDDFTKALMIAWSFKLTDRFDNSHIQIKILVDNVNSRQYNVVCIDDKWVINYNDNGPEPLEKLPESFLVENLVVLNVPR